MWNSAPVSLSWVQIESFALAQPDGFILASPADQDLRSRFHFAGWSPEEKILISKKKLTHQKGKTESAYPVDSDLFSLLKTLTRPMLIDGQGKAPFDQPGWFFTLSYEFSCFLSLPVCRFPDDQILAAGLRPGILFRKDLKTGEIRLFTTDRSSEKVIQDISRTPELPDYPEKIAGSACFRIPFPDYREKVNRILKAITRGDTYEVNFVHELTGILIPYGPASLWKRLTATSPSSFFTWFRTGSRILISSSPERFFRLENNRILVQPMKGTRKRHSDPELDKQESDSLKNSEKDRAENLMIVDLMRNDLGKICSPGSVLTEQLFTVESYPTVHQMTSTISGKLAGGLTIWDVIEALFPPGSMTGAPKKRTMDIISEEETGPRGFYSGISGYFDGSGLSEWSVLIRCLEVEGDAFSAKAGGAITADSDPAQEYAETLIKLKAILDSLGLKPEEIGNFSSGPHTGS